MEETVRSQVLEVIERTELVKALWKAGKKTCDEENENGEDLRASTN